MVVKDNKTIKNPCLRYALKQGFFYFVKSKILFPADFQKS